ncbi:MAG: aminopeptidase P family N-terminal domain-containing protein, partial [Leptolyngbyaceae cyanobacterium bins.59]|nr:aminopeptidase P family N-terminal domain-containing protein [Leptolyngbyaceae cyanobacterium bins.59]
MSPVELLQSTANSATAIQAKLASLRSQMTAHQLDAYLVLSGDEHLNEYVPEAKQRRTWISGFTGSVGDVLIGLEQAWVFVDSRYYEQADLQMQGTGIQVSKLGLEDHKTLVETLETWGQEASEQQRTLRLGFDPFTLSIAQFQELRKQVEPNGVALVPLPQNLVDQVRDHAPWIDQEVRPPYATSLVFQVPDAYTGESTAKKLDRVREAMKKSKIDILPLTKLDQIAWLFNLRGWDVSYNPVFIAYGIVTQEQAFLFTNLERIEETLRQTLSAIVTFSPYEAYGKTFHTLVRQPQAVRVLLDPRHTTVGTRQLLIDARNTLGHKQVQLVEGTHPVEGLKARKNTIEIAQMRAANLKASRAKIRTLKWVDDQVAAGASLNEQEIAQTIERFYQEEAEFQGLSFNTIAATGSNSSIVHYGTPSSECVVQPGHLVLLDSGAQYLGGTTDDTRTLMVGTPTPQQIERYTEVLKAHINCALQRFPKGTTGSQLDGITRANLWAIGLEYGHGTG